MGLIAELRRRNVLRMAGLYLVGAWLGVQVASTLLPVFDAPSWVMRALIVTLAIGFVLAVIFAWVFELTPEGLRRDEGDDGPNPIAPATARRLDRAIIAVLACALAYFAVDKFVLTPRSASSPSDASPKSIAVVPLANTSGDPANEYFSDGMTEEIIAALGKVRDLTVIGRNSSFRFKGTNDDPKSIAAQLGVAYLLEGSVRKASERVRISVDLVHASNGVSLWSETFDGELADVFALQTRIASAVAGKLQATLAGASGDNGAATRNVAAHTALLQANYYANKQTEADMRKAITYYDEAVRLDPDYALAQAALSRALSDLGAIWLGGEESRAAFEKARAAAQAALALAPQSSLAHQALGDIKLQADFDFAGAGEEYRRAIALAPSEPVPKVAYGAWLLARGELEDALALLREALAIDPVRTEAYTFAARALVAMDRLDEAEATARRGLDVQPDASRLHTVLTEIALLRDRPDVALAEAHAEGAGFWHEFAMTLALQKQNDRAAADAALAALSESWADSGGSQIAIVHALRGEPDRVFEWLDRAYAARDTGALFIPLTDPFLRPYRSDPRFEAYLRKAGFRDDAAP